MSTLPVLRPRRLDPWRLLRLLLVLAVVLVLARLLTVDSTERTVPVPEVTFLPLLLASVAAFGALVSVAVGATCCSSSCSADARP